MADDDGFTLVETVVALGLFALISLAAMGLVDGTLRAERSTSGRLERLDDIDRALAIVTRDLEAAKGSVTGDAEALTITPAATGRGPVIRYRLANGRLERGRDDGGATVAGGFTRLRWDYLGPDGWQDGWGAARPGRPRAIAVEISLGRSGAVRRVVDLTDGRP